MFTDNHFWIGSHKVCQDYALSGTKDGVVFAIVCDGCSSSRDTDIGARLIARSALNQIKEVSEDYFGDLVITEAIIQGRALGLKEEALDATLVIAAIIENRLLFKCYGDGAMALISKNGEYKVWEVEQDNGAPKYLSYRLNKTRESLYNIEFPGTTTINNAAGLRENNLIELFDISKSDIAAAIVMSDGFKSFYKIEETETSKNSIPVSSLDIYNELLAFKSYNGHFIDRRVTSFRKNLNKNIHHYDDCSMAGISI